MCACDRVRARTCLFPNCAYCFVVIASFPTYQFPVLVLLVSFKWFLWVSVTNCWRLPLKSIGFLPICISYHSSIHMPLKKLVICKLSSSLISKYTQSHASHPYFFDPSSLLMSPYKTISLVLTKSYIPSVHNPDLPVVLLFPRVARPLRYPLFIDTHRHP